MFDSLVRRSCLLCRVRGGGGCGAWLVFRSAHRSFRRLRAWRMMFEDPATRGWIDMYRLIRSGGTCFWLRVWAWRVGFRGEIKRDLMESVYLPFRIWMIANVDELA